MNTAFRLLFESSGFLIIIVGGWFGWRARQRLIDKRVPSTEMLLAMAVIFLGFSIIRGLYFSRALHRRLVMALEMRRQQKAEAQRIGDFSAR